MKFRLERIERLRRRERDHVQAKLATAERLVAAERTRHESLVRLGRETAASLEERLRGGIPALAMRAAMGAVAQARREASEAEERVQHCEALCEQVRAELRDAFRRVRSLERLRERRALQARRDVQRREARSLDEVGVRGAQPGHSLGEEEARDALAN